MSAAGLAVGLVLVVVGAYLCSSMALGDGWLFEHFTHRRYWACAGLLVVGFLTAVASGTGVIGDGL